jgi:site-specific recombinase
VFHYQKRGNRKADSQRLYYLCKALKTDFCIAERQMVTTE